jgi:anti-sigma B factor antagonist
VQLNTRFNENIIIIDISGEVDLYNSPNIKDMIIDKMNSGYKKIVLNLNDVSYIDSSGIGTLIYCRTTLNQANGQLKIINIKDSVKRIFELTRLVNYFNVFDSEEAAIKSFI